MLIFLYDIKKIEFVFWRMIKIKSRYQSQKIDLKNQKLEIRYKTKVDTKMEKTNMDKVLMELHKYIPRNHHRRQDYDISKGVYTCMWMWLKGINQYEPYWNGEDDDIDREYKFFTQVKAEGFTDRVLLDYLKFKDENYLEEDSWEETAEIVEKEWKANIILNKELELCMNALWNGTNLCEDVMSEILGFL